MNSNSLSHSFPAFLVSLLLPLLALLLAHPASLARADTQSYPYCLPDYLRPTPSPFPVNSSYLYSTPILIGVPHSLSAFDELAANAMEILINEVLAYPTERVIITASGLEGVDLIPSTGYLASDPLFLPLSSSSPSSLFSLGVHESAADEDTAIGATVAAFDTSDWAPFDWRAFSGGVSSSYSVLDSSFIPTPSQRQQRQQTVSKFLVDAWEIYDQMPEARLVDPESPSSPLVCASDNPIVPCSDPVFPSLYIPPQCYPTPRLQCPIVFSPSPSFRGPVAYTAALINTLNLSLILGHFNAASLLSPLLSNASRPLLALLGGLDSKAMEMCAAPDGGATQLPCYRRLLVPPFSPRCLTAPLPIRYNSSYSCAVPPVHRYKMANATLANKATRVSFLLQSFNWSPVDLFSLYSSLSPSLLSVSSSAATRSSACSWLRGRQLAWRPWLMDRQQCGPADWTASVGACDESRGEYDVTYEWLWPKSCVGGLALPASESLSCGFVNQQNTSYAALCTVAGLLAVFPIVFSCLLMIQRVYIGGEFQKPLGLHRALALAKALQKRNSLSVKVKPIENIEQAKDDPAHTGAVGAATVDLSSRLSRGLWAITTGLAGPRALCGVVGVIFQLGLLALLATAWASVGPITPSLCWRRSLLLLCGLSALAASLAVAAHRYRVFLTMGEEMAVKPLLAKGAAFIAAILLIYIVVASQASEGLVANGRHTLLASADMVNYSYCSYGPQWLMIFIFVLLALPVSGILHCSLSCLSCVLNPTSARSASHALTSLGAALAKRPWKRQQGIEDKKGATGEGNEGRTVPYNGISTAANEGGGLLNLVRSKPQCAQIINLLLLSILYLTGLVILAYFYLAPHDEPTASPSRYYGQSVFVIVYVFFVEAALLFPCWYAQLLIKRRLLAASPASGHEVAQRPTAGADGSRLSLPSVFLSASQPPAHKQAKAPAVVGPAVGMMRPAAVTIVNRAEGATATAASGGLAFGSSAVASIKRPSLSVSCSLVIHPHGSSSSSADSSPTSASASNNRPSRSHSAFNGIHEAQSHYAPVADRAPNLSRDLSEELSASQSASGKGQPAGPLASLSRVLSDPVAALCFQEYAESSYNGEHINYLLEVQDLLYALARPAFTLPALRQSLKRLYERFVAADAPEQINVSGQLRGEFKKEYLSLVQDIEGQMTNGSAAPTSGVVSAALQYRPRVRGLFMSSIKEVYSLLNVNSYARFLQSPYGAKAADILDWSDAFGGLAGKFQVAAIKRFIAHLEEHGQWPLAGLGQATEEQLQQEHVTPHSQCESQSHNRVNFHDSADGAMLSLAGRLAGAKEDTLVRSISNKGGSSLKASDSAAAAPAPAPVARSRRTNSNTLNVADLAALSELAPPTSDSDGDGDGDEPGPAPLSAAAVPIMPPAPSRIRTNSGSLKALAKRERPVEAAAAKYASNTNNNMNTTTLTL